MAVESEQTVGELITQVRLDIRELMTEVKSLKNLGEKIEQIRDRTIQVEESVDYAHRRLDRIDKVIYWGSTTIIGALLIGSVALLYKNQGG